MNPTELQSGDKITVDADVPFDEATVTDVDIKNIGLTTVYGVGITVGNKQYAIEGTTASDESTITDVHNTDEWDASNESISLS
jgi:hypothetical protein